MANVCFTCGWIIELAVNRVRGALVESFVLGILFSAVLTLAPAVLAVGLVAILMILRLFGIGLN
jgi:hypothetical protein